MLSSTVPDDTPIGSEQTDIQHTECGLNQAYCTDSQEHKKHNHISLFIMLHISKMLKVAK